MSSKSFNGSRLGSSSSKQNSSKKSKRSKSDIKPMQPQRGLGVAQLEKIRLGSEMNEHPTLLHSPLHNSVNMVHATVDLALQPSASRMPFPPLVFCPRFLMSACGRIERSELFGHNDTSYKNRNVYVDQTEAPTSTPILPLMEHITGEYSLQKKRPHDLSLSVGSKKTISESSNDEKELDLELKLSI